MRKILIILSLLFTFLCIGCAKQYVQVAQVSCDECGNVGSYLVSGNDSVRVVYYFWAENGVMGFSVQNRTKVPLYIDWKKCSYIYESTKNDYWSETTESITNNQTNRFAVNAFSWIDKTMGTSTTLITKQERITFIPPGSTISRGLYNLKNDGLVSIKSNRTEMFDTSVTIASGVNQTFSQWKGTFKYSRTQFDANQSPILFSSFLTCSTDEKFTKEFYINDKFYVSNILELPLELFNNSSKKLNSFQEDSLASPKSFYLKGKK